MTDGYGVIVMAGYLFGPACYTVASEHPEVLFLALDVTEGDLNADTVPSNIALICYQEEQAGYLAGYAAVQEGYKELASWAAWLSPQLSATATASCRR